jgi:hypothetical protein
MSKRSKFRHRGKNSGSKRQTNLTTSSTATVAASPDAPSVEPDHGPFKTGRKNNVAA